MVLGRTWTVTFQLQLNYFFCSYFRRTKKYILLRHTSWRNRRHQCYGGRVMMRLKWTCFVPSGSQEHSDSVPEVGEDAVSSVSSPTPPTALSEEERQELQEELVKVSRDQVWPTRVKIRFQISPVTNQSEIYFDQFGSFGCPSSVSLIHNTNLSGLKLHFFSLALWLVCVCVQVEEEIQTLSQVLAAKERLLADIKRRLGITPLNELKQNITKTWQDVTTSVAYVPYWPAAA